MAAKVKRVQKPQRRTLIARLSAPCGRFPVVPAWDRLKAWFAEHLPETLRSLSPGATVKQVKAVEKAIGRKLPPDVIESYRLHDGQKYPAPGGGVLYGLPLLSLKECLQQWQHWAKAREKYSKRSQDLDADCRSFPHGAVRDVYFHPGWLPISEDSGGNHLAVDLDPGPEGVVGQVIIFGRDDEDNHCALASTWGQLLTDLADELEGGNYRLDDEEGANEPVFSPAIPDVKHFHLAGKCWTRAKMGLRRLNKRDSDLWRKSGWARHRCVIFPTSSRPVTLDPAWRTPELLALARTVHDNRILPAGILDPERLAVLADALEDAGCTNADILGHLRGPGPHVRGCWAVDTLLDKS